MNREIQWTFWGLIFGLIICFGITSYSAYSVYTHYKEMNVVNATIIGVNATVADSRHCSYYVAYLIQYEFDWNNKTYTNYSSTIEYATVNDTLSVYFGNDPIKNLVNTKPFPDSFTIFLLLISFACGLIIICGLIIELKIIKKQRRHKHSIYRIATPLHSKDNDDIPTIGSL